MKQRAKRVLLTFGLLLAFLSGTAVSAQEQASDSTELQPVSFRAEVESDDSLQVTFTALDAVDVYAFELQVDYDDKRLKFKEAPVAARGFTVPPVVDEGRIQIAHTLVGPVAGASGTVELVTVSFERIAPGPAWVELSEVKLVDSQIRSLVYTPKLGQTLPDQAVMLTDIADHWAEAAIREAVGLGFVSGYPDGSFRPDGRITRAEFAVMLVRAMKLPIAHSPAPGFADGGSIQGWAGPYIAAAVEAGWITGYEDGSFRPARNINRAEITMLIVRAMGETQAEALDSPDFADQDDIPDWALASVSLAYEKGLVLGRPNHRLDPLGYSTRAEAAVTILRLLKLR